ncbi:hypothetical protein ACFX2J_012901 [Malus domestica]
MKEVVVEVADVDVVGTSTIITTTKEEEAQQKVFGHYAWECRAPSNRLDEKVNYVKEEKEDNGVVLLACQNNDGDQDYTWYLDIGTSNHICRRISMFVELNESVSGNVSFGHLNFGGLELLSKKEMVRGLPCISRPDQACE